MADQKAVATINLREAEVGHIYWLRQIFNLGESGKVRVELELDLKTKEIIPQNAYRLNPNVLARSLERLRQD